MRVERVRHQVQDLGDFGFEFSGFCRSAHAWLSLGAITVDCLSNWGGARRKSSPSHCSPHAYDDGKAG
ncbi:hypothetical protein TI01_0645 [Lysobacter sp. A03]|nr:hypothetical protein TI01_0645 [Lysobacter sp. A03]